MRNFTRTVRAFLTLGFIAGLTLADIGSTVGIASGLNSMFGGSPGGNYGQGSGASASTGALEQISPQMLQAFQQLLQIDPSQYIGAGQRAGGQYADQAQLNQIYQQLMGGQAMQGQQNQAVLRGAGNQIWNTGQDPQQALYNRTLQQIQDQSRQASSVRGIGMSPEAADLENQATGNFNIDWQNQQLARQLQAMQGLTGAYDASNRQGALIGADLSGASNFGAQVPANTMQSGAAPFQTQQQGYGAPFQYGTGYSSALNTAFNPQLANYNQGQYAAGQQQSSTGMQSFLTGLNQANQPGSWLNGLFGGSQGSNQPMSAYYGGYNPSELTMSSGAL